MGALHSDALERPTPAREPTADDLDASHETMDAEIPPGESRRAERRSRSRRSTSRAARTIYGLTDPSTATTTGSRIRIPGVVGLHDLLDDDKSSQEYSVSPYASSSAMPTPTAYAPSTSPVTGANRIRRASASASGARRRRLSIYSAGSVQAQMMDHGHAHPYAHAHAHSHSHVLPPPTSSPGYLHSGYGVGVPREVEDGDGEEENGADDEIMALEDALALDPIAEREHERARELVRILDVQRRSAVAASLSGERYSTAVVDTADDHAHGYGYTGARKGAGWIGGGAARLTGYYYHSERDHCDL